MNIASRMESTGVEGRIQASEKAMCALSRWYDFERRGSIFIKGKDNMTTFLLVNKRDVDKNGPGRSMLGQMVANGVVNSLEDLPNKPDWVLAYPEPGDAEYVSEDEDADGGGED